MLLSFSPTRVVSQYLVEKKFEGKLPNTANINVSVKSRLRFAKGFFEKATIRFVLPEIFKLMKYSNRSSFNNQRKAFHSLITDNSPIIFGREGIHKESVITFW